MVKNQLLAYRILLFRILKYFALSLEKAGMNEARKKPNHPANLCPSMGREVLLILCIVILLTIFFPHLRKQQSANQIQESSTLITKKLEINQETILIVVGDINLGREINWQIKIRQDPIFPFINIAPIIKTAHLAFGNLEGPVIINCPILRNGFKFCGEKENIKGLSFAGFNLMNLSNNHIANYGPDGIQQTIQALEKNNIDYCGLEKIFYKKIII